MVVIKSYLRLSTFKKAFERFIEFFEIKHDCPNCKTELDCYGSHPWGRFTYECGKCKYKEPEYEER